MSRRTAGGLVDAGPEYDKHLAEEVAKLQRLFGGGDLASFPEFKFPGDEEGSRPLRPGHDNRWMFSSTSIITQIFCHLMVQIKGFAVENVMSSQYYQGGR